MMGGVCCVYREEEEEEEDDEVPTLHQNPRIAQLMFGAMQQVIRCCF